MKLPRVVFVNKMDRQGASLSRVIDGMTGKRFGSHVTRRGLNGWGVPVLIHWPVNLSDERGVRGPGSSGPNLLSIFNLVEFKICDFSAHESGSVVKKYGLEDSEEITGSTYFPAFLEEVETQRRMMIDQLCEFDDDILNLFIDLNEDYSKIPLEIVQNTIQKLTLNGKIVPVLCGSAFKNMGVQLLLDAIVDYLPSPLDRPLPTLFKRKPNALELVFSLDPINTTLALAFKIINDINRGKLVFVRIYTGHLDSKSKIWNATRQSYEKITQCLKLFGGDVTIVDTLLAGDIGALVGLNDTYTGDTLSSFIPGNQETDHILENIRVGTPVVFCTLKPTLSSSDAKFLKVLENATIEDPSLQYESIPNGDLILKGMGELHLETSIEKIRVSVKGGVERGVLSVNYKETLNLVEALSYTFTYDQELFGKRVYGSIEIEINQMSDYDENVLLDAKIKEGGNLIKFDINAFEEILEVEEEGYKKSVIEGLEGGLSRGAHYGLPVTNLSITIKQISLLPKISTPASIRTTAFICIGAAMKTSKCVLLEPIMHISISVPDKFVGNVTKDISGGLKGTVISMGEEGEEDIKEVEARAALRGLVGYSSKLRAITKGNGQLQMELLGYGVVSEDKVDVILKEIRGF